MKLTLKQMQEFLRVSKHTTPDDVIQSTIQSHSIAPQAVRELMEARELLEEILPGAKWQSCAHRDQSDADPAFHCCDWGGWIEKVKQYLGE